MESSDCLWIEKYCPKTLDELTYNESATSILRSLSKSDDFPHLIFYGLDGAGKKTRIHAFLEAVYGPGSRKIVSELKELKVNSTTNEYLITSSNYHIELTPSDLEIRDKYLIQNVIKETANTSQLDQKSQKRFKVIVLLQADKLTKEAQAALRRTMEKYSSNCRIIMSCTSLSKIIPPIRSRCLSIRVGYPSNEEITKTLINIAEKEMYGINEEQINAITENCQGNIRTAISSLQLTSLGGNRNDVFTPEYINTVKGLAKKIIGSQKVSTISECRQILQRLLVNGIPKEIVFLTLMREFLNSNYIDDKKKLEIVNLTSLFDNRASNGAKTIMHLEAYIAGVMATIADIK